MKTRLYILFTLLIAGSQVFGQCGARYKDMIFPNVTITSDITYSTSNGTTLKLDVYEPTGDTLSARPVLVMAHGGSFYGGTKTDDNAVTTFCNNFAKRGYVTVSIDYRLAASFLNMIDSQQATNEVMKSIGDAKSAVRFLRKDAYTTNTYRIDTNHIFGGGNSAGAVLFAHYIYIDSLGEAPPGLHAVIVSNGGIEGNSGNAGYSSEIKALVNLAGGLNLPEFIGPGSKPSFNAQGDQDATVPYECGYPLSGGCPVRLCGLGGMEPQYLAHGIYHQTIVFPGDGHVPWQTDAAKMTRIDTNAANFLYTVLCGTSSSVNDVAKDNDVSLYPNPVSDLLNVSFKEINSYTKVQLLDATGRLVEEKGINAPLVNFNCNNLSSGMYFVKIVGKDASVSVKKVMLN